MNFSNLEKSILKTLIYFDTKNYPLTSMELADFLFCYRLKNFEELILVLEKLEQAGVIEEKNGYYFLSGREGLDKIRHTALVHSELKLKIARRAARLLAFIPFLRAIFVVNTVADGTAKVDSDIDFLIIAGAGRVWFVRFFANAILRLFGLRSYGKNTADKICLSFFIDDKNLNFSKLRVEGDDILFLYWIAKFVPIYDPKNYLKKFFSANFWIRDYLPNLPSYYQYQGLVRSNIFIDYAKIFFESINNGVMNKIEKKLFDWQWKKMSESVKNKSLVKDNGVVITDGIIKLHEHDSRKAVAKNFFEILSKYGLS